MGMPITLLRRGLARHARAGLLHRTDGADLKVLVHTLDERTRLAHKRLAEEKEEG